MGIGFTTASLITAIISFILGIFVYLKNTKSAVNRTWLAFSLSVSIWSFGVFSMHNSPDKSHALFWIRIMYIGASFVPSSYLHFIFSLLGKDRATRTRRILILAYICTVIFFASNFTPLLVKDVGPKFSYVYYTTPGILFPLFSLFFFASIVYALYTLSKMISHVSAVKKNQLVYILTASIIGFSGAASTFLPIFNIKIYPVGYYLIPIYSLIVSIAIVKYHLMDIDIVIKKGTVYAYLSFSILVPCMIGIILAQKFFFNQANSFFTFLTFCALLLTSLVMLRVKPYIEDYIEKRMFKRKYEYKKALEQLSTLVISFLDEKELFKKAGNIFTKDLGTKNVSFYLMDKEKRAYTLRASQNLRKTQGIALPRDDLLLQWLQEKGKAVVREEIERIDNDPQITSVVKTLDSMESEVCIPLMTRDELIGIINLGHKRSGEMYSHEDLDLLTQFATQASVALENARLYQEMQRTHMLMRRTDRLASLGSLTAGLAHEIRNPLVAIKTFLDLLPKRYRDKEFRGDFLKLTTAEVDRIDTLVTGLLNFARPSQPTVQKNNVNQVIEEVISLMAAEAKKKNIAIDTNLQKISQAMFDQDQMKQVLLNLFLNAIEATSARGKISVASRNIQKNGMEYVQVEIADTGKGIPEKIVEQIFDPFFTTKGKGVGLGLSISHQIVQEHHGTIEVESRAKKGTTFFVNLPCTS